MRCPHCNGTGRTVGLSGFGQGKKAPYMTQEIGPCPECHGGHQHCCEGEQPTVMADPELKVQFVWAEPDAEDLNGSGC